MDPHKAQRNDRKSHGSSIIYSVVLCFAFLRRGNRSSEFDDKEFLMRKTGEEIKEFSSLK